MVSIPRALRRVKDDLPSLITPHVQEAVALQPNLHWRDRVLNPVTTMWLFILQVMHGNTAIPHLRHLSPLRFTAAAYCKARMRLPLALVQRVSARLTGELLGAAAAEVPRWRGHRVWFGDGTSFSMPDTPVLQQHFGQHGAQKPGCGFPVATLLVLCNAAGFIVRTIACPLRTHEASQLRRLHEQLQPGDVLVYDRAGCSFVHLALLAQQGWHGLFRVHQRQIVSFRPGRKHAGQVGKTERLGAPKSRWIQRLGKHDQLVRWFKPSSRPVWMTGPAYADLPDSITVRELRYAVTRKGFRSRTITLVTTLLDPREYPAEELAGQYLGRWNIEVNFRHLKQTMKMDVLKCKTVDGVLKELAVFTLVYNLVRLVMLRAAQRQRVPLDRISFIDALRWLRDARDTKEPMDLIVAPHWTLRSASAASSHA